MKIYLEWFEMPCIGIYSGLFGITWFSGVWMHEQHSRSVQVEASNRLGSDNQESIHWHNHTCDRIKLTRHKSDTRTLRQNKSSRL